MASLDDILTTQKNGVVAINGILTALTSLTDNVGNPLLLSRGAATASYSVLYTSPANTETYIRDITVCNTTASAVTFYISLVPSGGTAGASNAIFYSNSLAAYTTIQWTGFQVINSGGTIQGYASSTGCTFNISGGTSA